MNDDYVKFILANLPNSVYWKDLNGVYLGANIHAVNMVGLDSVEDIIGKTDYDITSKENADLFRKNDAKVINENREVSVEEKAQFSGKDIIQLSTKKPIKDQAGNIIGVMGVTVDITDLKQKEIMLLEKSEALEKVLSEKRKFLNNLSHEIRTPMHIINSIIEELVDKLNYFSKEELADFVIVLRNNTKILMKLVTNLLDAAKSTQKKIIYHFQKRDILTAVKKAIDEFKQVTSISVEIQYDNALIYMDELRIIQVLRNILDNAIKYGKPGSIIVELKKTEDQKNILVQVKNKGIGLSQKENEKIFEPFFQGSNNPINTHSTGLGLTICKEIISEHKGDIWVTQEANITCMNFTIPCIKQSHKKILFVDDDQVVLRMGGMMIKNLGYEVLLVDSGEKAISVMKDAKLDISCIFLDLRMPGIDGFDVLTFMKNFHINIPVIIQTGEIHDDDIKRVNQLGAKDYITKPYNKLDIKAAIAKVESATNFA